MTAQVANPAATPGTVWTAPHRDKYGRPCTYLRAEGSARTQAVVCTLPKAYAEQYGNRYLVNLWLVPLSTPEDVKVTHHPTRAAAKAHAEQAVRDAFATGNVTDTFR